MLRIKFFFRDKIKNVIFKEILEECKQKWGDEESFLNKLFQKSEILVVVKNIKNSTIGFSLVGRIELDNVFTVVFFATRVLLEHRNQGLGKLLVGKILRYYLLRYKVMNFLNWFKPVYFVSIIANPIVYNSFRKSFNVFPSPNKADFDLLIFKIAEKFVNSLDVKNNFDIKSFVVSEFFKNSAEYYFNESDIPWSGNKMNDSFLKNLLDYQSQNGNGLLILGRIL